MDETTPGSSQVPFLPVCLAHSYRRAPPNLFNLTAPSPDVLGRFLQMVSQPVACSPIEGIHVLDSCYIYEGNHVMLPTGEWLPSTVFGLGIADLLKPVLQNVIKGGHHGRLEPHPDPTVVIGRAGSSNYGHVLADILPKIINIKRAKLSRFRLLLPAESSFFLPVIIDLLGALALHADIRQMAKAELLQADTVYIVSPVSKHDSLKSQTFLELRTVLRELYYPDTTLRRRIFVKRGPNDSRRMTNWPDVEAMFVRYGFDLVYPPMLSIPDQIRLFSNASHIAGSLGAGMSNIAFAPADCEVMMIDPGLGDYFFWDFSCLLQQRFSWFFAGPLLGYNAELAVNDFTVDLGALESSLQLLYS